MLTCISSVKSLHNNRRTARLSSLPMPKSTIRSFNSLLSMQCPCVEREERLQFGYEQVKICLHKRQKSAPVGSRRSFPNRSCMRTRSVSHRITYLRGWTLYTLGIHIYLVELPCHPTILCDVKTSLRSQVTDTITGTNSTGSQRRICSCYGYPGLSAIM